MRRVLFYVAAVMAFVGHLPQAQAFSKDVPKGPSTKSGFTSMTDQQNKATASQMPNPNHPETRAALHCNLCIAVAHEAFVQLEALRRLRHNTPKYVEYVDTLETLCKFMEKDYGLAVDDATKRPLLLFRAKKDTPQQVSGQWITNMIAERCGDLTDQYESQIIKLSASAKDEETFTRQLCIDVASMCSKVDVATDDL